MNASAAAAQRKEPRFKINEGQILSCETSLDSEEDELRTGTVVDVSTNGIRILCDGYFKAGQAIATELKTGKSHGVFRGTVRRIEPWVGGKSVLGCELTDPIPSGLLAELATAGIVNRRREHRVHWDQPASLSWELQPGEIDIEIRDYSLGGMRIFSEQSFPQDVKLKIRVTTAEDEQIVVAATSIWKEDSGQGVEAGLAFTAQSNAKLVSQMRRSTGSAEQTAHAAPAPLIRPAVQVTAATVLLGVALWQWLPAAQQVLAEIF
ncbi:MAG: PilZ domain-containing protein [Pirellulales bacterium]|nr:PilZ domain-containing protein [Pirellulales bacterium]